MILPIKIRNAVDDGYYDGWALVLRAKKLKNLSGSRDMVIPLVSWIWIGGIVMILGTLIAMGPDRLKKKSAVISARKPTRQKREVEHAV